MQQKPFLYLIGGHGTENTCQCFDPEDRKLSVKAQMLQEKTFFSAVCLEKTIYTFGGYDAYDKAQLASCEMYDIEEDKWTNPHNLKLNLARS